MLIFGSRSVDLGFCSLYNHHCPHCKEFGTVNLHFFRKHAHLFFVPIFPFGKEAISECAHCKQVLNMGQMPLEWRKDYVKAEKTKTAPRWQYSGLFMIPVLFGFFIVMAFNSAKQTDAFCQNPAVGDILTLKMDFRTFTTSKIVKVTQDSVFMVMNDYEIDKATAVFRIDKEANYTSAPVSLARTDLIQLREDNTIQDINRE